MQSAEKKIFDYLKAHEEEIIADIIRLMEAESPSRDKAATDACARVLADMYKERLGATSEIHPTEELGDHLRTTIGDGQKKILVVGHFDTVHPIGSVPISRDERYLYGPGVMDMKGGDVAVIWALKALRECGVGIPSDKKFVVVNNSDEEIGSRSSRDLLYESAQGAAACVIAEPSASGGYTTSRKGGGGIMIRVHGRAAHSGAALADGINANLELAHQILFFASLTELDKRSSFSPNIISGGRLGNVVSDHAEARIDWRMYTPDEEDRVKKIIADRKPVIEGAKVEFEARVGRPAFPETPGGAALFDIVCEAAAALDLTATKAPTSGGISDGNLISARGIPTIDGMGVVGELAHNPGERAPIDQLVPRMATLASFFTRV